MKLSSEAKIGVIGILTMVILIWGINYLKGRSILSSTYTLHAFLDDAGGLESSAPVLMNGVKVGYVKTLTLRPGDPKPIRIVLNVEKEYPINNGSSAVLFSIDLLGSKAVRIDVSRDLPFLEDNDTIQMHVELDMLSSMQDKLNPVLDQISSLAVSLDTLSSGLDQLISTESVSETMDHLAAISGALKASLDPGGSLHQGFLNLESFTSVLKDQEDEFSSLAEHLNSISQKVDSADIDKLTHELLSLTQQFNQLMTKINAGEGNAGKFFQEDSLYLNLDILISDLDALIKDLNENPGDYVHISLFGNSQKKK